METKETDATFVAVIRASILRVPRSIWQAVQHGAVLVEYHRHGELVVLTKEHYDMLLAEVAKAQRKAEE